MKVVVAAIFLFICSSASLAAAQRYTLDVTHTTVAFLIDHIGYAKTLGYFSAVTGTFEFDIGSNKLNDVSIVVKTDSVQSDNKARDKHVRGKDFLNAKKFPTMVFSAQSGSIDGAGEGQIDGQLTLLGQTLPLTLTVKLNKAEKYPFGHKKFTLGISARGELMRSAYGMEYGVANGLVGDAVQLIIETEAIQE